MTTIVILGSTGLLGQTLLQTIKDEKSVNVIATTRKPGKGATYHKFDAASDRIADILKGKSVDYIVNCIGLTNKIIDETNAKSVQQAILINAHFPHQITEALDKTSVKCINISTDCVFDGNHGNYLESHTPTPTDIYSQTKLLGEVQYSSQVLNIRTSIIGHKSSKGDNLLDWFLAHKDGSSCDGYVNHIWNGTSTLRYAKLVLAIIKNGVFEKIRNTHHTHHYAGTDPVSKYELLKKVNSLYDRDIKVKKVTHGSGTNRSLLSEYTILEELLPKKDIDEVLKELKASYKSD